MFKKRVEKTETTRLVDKRALPDREMTDFTIIQHINSINSTQKDIEKTEHRYQYKAFTSDNAWFFEKKTVVETTIEGVDPRQRPQFDDFSDDIDSDRSDQSAEDSGDNNECCQCCGKRKCTIS
jgi:hypothetical protein